MTTRVLQIIPTVDRGGAEKQMTLLATGLPRDQFDVHVCLLSRTGPYLEQLQQHDIPTIEINKTWKVDPGAYFRLKRAIRELKPDLVHTWIFAANSYGRQAAFAAGVKNVVAGERCVDEWKASYELAIDRHLAKRTSKIATNSSGVKDFYVERGLPADKFEIIPNGIAMPAAPQTTREELLKSLNIDDDTFVIGAIGRLWPQKRHKDLIWAAHLLEEAGHKANLLIVGDGPQRWRLERYTSQVFRDSDCVRFLGHRNDVSEIAPHLDCFWLGSGYEGQSNALMEAMSHGLPTVVTDIPGNRDLVIEDETGYFVKVGDRAGFTKKTHLLIEDRQLAQQLGNAGRARVQSEFTIEKMIERHVEMYRKLVESV